MNLAREGKTTELKDGFMKQFEISPDQRSMLAMALLESNPVTKNLSTEQKQAIVTAALEGHEQRKVPIDTAGNEHKNAANILKVIKAAEEAGIAEKTLSLEAAKLLAKAGIMGEAKHTSFQDVLRKTLENMRRSGEVYVCSRFHLGETPHNFEEFQTTANPRAFSMYDKRTGIYQQGQLNTAPMHLHMQGNLRTDWGYEQIIGCHPHFDRRQWIVYYHAGGRHGGNDGRPGIPLGIGVSFPTKNDAEKILSIFEQNPSIIRPFFLEAGKEAAGTGVAKVLTGERAPSLYMMQGNFLVVREDSENFDARYVDNSGNTIPMKPELQGIVKDANNSADGAKRRRLAREEEAKKPPPKKSWWKFW